MSAHPRKVKHIQFPRQACQRLASQVMEMQPVDCRLCARLAPQRIDAAWFQIEKPVWQLRPHRQRPRGKGHIARLAVFRHFQMRHPPAHILGAQRADFARAHRRFHRPHCRRPHARRLRHARPVFLVAQTKQDARQLIALGTARTRQRRSRTRNLAERIGLQPAPLPHRPRADARQRIPLAQHGRARHFPQPRIAPRHNVLCRKLRQRHAPQCARHSPLQAQTVRFIRVILLDESRQQICHGSVRRHLSARHCREFQFFCQRPLLRLGLGAEGIGRILSALTHDSPPSPRAFLKGRHFGTPPGAFWYKFMV